jgi:hypothetical protein
VGTKLSGIGAAENLDSSSEILSIEGLDISSIHDGTAFLNYEHQNTNPTNGCVGKILYGKKIFTEQDCETADQKKWWDLAQVPFLYIIGELFDEEGHSAATDIAAMLAYDEKLRQAGRLGKDGLKPVVNFSVEGAKLKSEGNRITRSIARKVSVTVLACNKICQAAIYKEPEQQQASATPKEAPKMAFNEIKKQIIQKKMIKSEGGSLAKAESNVIPFKGMGTTSSGKTVSVDHGGNYDGWDHNDHKEAANKHYNAFLSAKAPQQKMQHMKKVNFHMRMGGKIESRQPKISKAENRCWDGYKPTPGKKPYSEGSCIKKSTKGKMVKNQNPLEKEQLFTTMVKNEDLAIPVWSKVTQFREWVGKQAPGLSQDEVDALTRLMAHAKWTKAETALKDI